MKDSQVNYLNMTNATTDVMDKNVPLWTANAKVTAALAAVKATVVTINSLVVVQTQSAKGATQNKAALWAVAIQKAEHVCVGLKAYADDSNDLILYGIIDFSHSDFSRCTVLESVARMQLVRDKAASITIANLLAFGIVAADITGLQTAITNLVAAIPSRTSMVAATTTSTSQLSVVFKTLRGQMKRLDNLVNTFKVLQPTFITTYTNARKIINLGKTMRAKEITLKPYHFEALFGKKYTINDSFTIRNHGEANITVALTDTPTVMPQTNLIDIPANTEYKLIIAENFGAVFGHWLMVYNPNAIDTVMVTVILARGKSNSQAQTIGNISV